MNTADIFGLTYTFPTAELATEAAELVATATQACRTARTEAEDDTARGAMLIANAFARTEGTEVVMTPQERLQSALAGGLGPSVYREAARRFVELHGRTAGDVAAERRAFRAGH